MQWRHSVSSYAYYYETLFSRDHDPSQVVGQDNILRYVPRKQMGFRVERDDPIVDVMRVIAAAITCKTPLEISGSEESLNQLGFQEFQRELEGITWIVEEEATLVDRIHQGKVRRLRLVKQPSSDLISILETTCYLLYKPVLANGRVELLNYLREVAISFDYHRYGNLGDREEDAKIARAE